MKLALTILGVFCFASAIVNAKSNVRDAIQKDYQALLRPVMHACDHDVQITALAGTAVYMQANLSDWSGTLMLIAQPAAERIMGAE
ncbi:MAG: metal-dependent amidase/aminoacylase/carboxypeptidase family protein [Paraglaciecola sp.]|jgi:metal-dependent amidase/aminoacylase/carboxypeptidase family protein